MINSSIRFSLTGGQVGWTRNTSRPRMSSSILQEISPSGKLPSEIVAQRQAQVVADPLGQLGIGPAAEDLEVVHENCR